MIKKIAFILILFTMFFSCGKKDDPVYVDPNKKVHVLNIINIKIS